MERALSLYQRYLVDRLEATRRVPLCHVSRTMLLSPVAALRADLRPHPSWAGLFARTFAQLAVGRPELRRCLLSPTRPRIYEHPISVAAVGLERCVGDESGLMFTRLRRPEVRCPREIDRYLRRCQHGPLGRVPLFRRMLGLSRWPAPVRRLFWWWATSLSGPRRVRYLGTFAVGPLGPTLATPLTCTLGHGPLQYDGAMEVVLWFDPRLLTAGTAVQTLVEVEQELNGPLRAKLHSLANHPSIL